MAPDEVDAFGNRVEADDEAAPEPYLGDFVPPVAPEPVANVPAPEEPTPAFPKTAPGATMAMALGVMGLLVPVLAPVAWIYGRSILRAIDASGGRLGGRGQAGAARMLGMLGTALLVISMGIAISEGVGP